MQLSKALVPMLLRVEGSVILFRVLLWKELLPMVVKPSGRTTFSIFIDLKALSAIAVTV